MTVYVDDLVPHVDIRGMTSNPGWARTILWCHMAIGINDDIEELHEMAGKIGLKREWFQDHELHPHYDLRASKRKLAVQNGAIEVDRHMFVKLCSRYFHRPE